MTGYSPKMKKIKIISVSQKNLQNLTDNVKHSLQSAILICIYQLQGALKYISLEIPGLIMHQTFLLN